MGVIDRRSQIFGGACVADIFKKFFIPASKTGSFILQFYISAAHKFYRWLWLQMLKTQQLLYFPQ